MNDILINCPCDSHKQARFNSVLKEVGPIPKILLLASQNTRGKIKIQCSDNWCRRYNKGKTNGKYNSWYEIDFNSLGGYTITALPARQFPVTKVPTAVMGAI